jgi:hypothetical protein
MSGVEPGVVVPAVARVPSGAPSGTALLALELGKQARGMRGLDVLRRSVDRAPPHAA